MAPSSRNNHKKSELPLVPESILKKRHDLEALARHQRELASAKTTTTSKSRKTLYIKKPETIVARARSAKNQAIRYKRVQQKGMQKRASNTKQYAAGGDNNNTKKHATNSVGATLVFAIRIRNHIGAPPPVRRTLAALRLRNLHEGVFLRYDDATRKQLHLVEPFVVYGPPSHAIIADLVERRGFGTNDQGQRVPLSDNTIIEDVLGADHSMVCTEDLVHEIANVGPSFVEATAFLWPFRLADNLTEFERKTLKIKDGKSYGDRGEEINEYLREVL